MLRRRILASAMASVMAIGTVAVVANAEDAAVASTVTKTKAELQEYVDSFAEDRKDDIHNYGSKSATRFLDALEYADNVLKGAHTPISTDAVDADDYTVAYYMVKTTHAEMLKHFYDAAKLQKLIDDCTPDYNSRNILNEVLGDNKWTKESFEDFEIAYEAAKAVVLSTDTRITTDAYEELEEAWKALTELPDVSKSEFRSALQEYEAALQLEYKYEPWRRSTTGTPFGNTFVAARAVKDEVNEYYKKLDAIKTASKTTDPDIVGAFKKCKSAADSLNNWKPDSNSASRKADVTSLLRKYNGRLVYEFVTSDTDVLAPTEEISISAETLLDKIVSLPLAAGVTDVVLVKQGETTNVQWVPVTDAFDKDSVWFTEYTAGKLSVAELTIKANQKFYIGLDKDGFAIGVSNKDDVPGAVTHRTVNVGTTLDLSDYIQVTSADVQVPFSTIGHTYQNSEDKTVHTNVGLTEAFEIAEKYINSDTNAGYRASGILYDGETLFGIDMNETLIADTLKGSTPEWALVHRYLYYALTDRYGDYKQPSGYTKEDVRKLIGECYTKANETGEAALFAYSHNVLVTARQEALDWLKSADKEKTYDDNVTRIGVPAANVYIDDAAGYGLTSDEVYKKLKKWYDRLDGELKAFPYSYQEVYDKIAEVAGRVDAGNVANAEEATAAIEAAAYALSTVKDLSGVGSNNEQITLADNSPFTADRLFQGYNRVCKTTATITLVDGVTVVTINNKAHKSLVAAFEALTKIPEKTEEEQKLVGDIDGDGTVNVFDAQKLLNDIVNNTTDALDIVVADVDTDGGITVKDAQAILEYINQ